MFLRCITSGRSSVTRLLQKCESHPSRSFAYIPPKFPKYGKKFKHLYEGPLEIANPAPAPPSPFWLTPPTSDYMRNQNEDYLRMDPKKYLEQLEAEKEKNPDTEFDEWGDHGFFQNMIQHPATTIDMANRFFALAKGASKCPISTYFFLALKYGENQDVEGVRNVLQEYEQEGGEVMEHFFFYQMFVHHRRREWEEVLKIYEQVFAEGLRPIAMIYVYALDAFRALNDWEGVQQLYKDMEKDGIEMPIAPTAFIDEIQASRALMRDTTRRAWLRTPAGSKARAQVVANLTQRTSAKSKEDLEAAFLYLNNYLPQDIDPTPEQIENEKKRPSNEPDKKALMMGQTERTVLGDASDLTEKELTWWGRRENYEWCQLMMKGNTQYRVDACLDDVLGIAPINATKLPVFQ